MANRASYARWSIALGSAVLLALVLGWLALRPSARPKGGTAPLELANLVATPGEVEVGGSAVVRVQVARGSGSKGVPRFAWRASGGAIEGSGDVVTWRAPAVVGAFLISVQATDADRSATARTLVYTRLPAPKASASAPAAVAVAAPNGPDPSERIRILEAELAVAPAADAPMLDFIANKHRRIELAGLMQRAGRYREALALYAGLIEEMAADDPNSGPYRAGFGRAALQLGREDEALEALQDANPAYTTREDQYTIGSLLEKRGRPREALEAYEQTMAGNVAWPPDTLFRRATLLTAEGRSSEAVETLVAFSPVLGREFIMARLNEDPELAQVRAALEQSGRQGELEGQHSVDPQTLPGAEPPSDQPKTIVHAIPGLLEKGYEL